LEAKSRTSKGTIMRRKKTRIWMKRMLGRRRKIRRRHI
jgi:hypothetical protein